MYWLILIIAVSIIYLALADKTKAKRLKRNGIRVPAIIISNSESGRSRVDMYRLGGNINTPTVHFVTKEGQDIIGAPVMGFITQYEVVPPVKVYVFYDPKDPKQFCLDMT